VYSSRWRSHSGTAGEDPVAGSGSLCAVSARNAATNAEDMANPRCDGVRAILQNRRPHREMLTRKRDNVVGWLFADEQPLYLIGRQGVAEPEALHLGTTLGSDRVELLFSFDSLRR